MQKRKAQKYQNRSSYRPKEAMQDIASKVSFNGLCPRCREQIEWKIQFNKYKPLTDLAKWSNFILFQPTV